MTICSCPSEYDGCNRLESCFDPKGCPLYPCQDVAAHGTLVCKTGVCDVTPSDVRNINHDAHDIAEIQEADALADARGGATSTGMVDHV